jgi:hypothetical protein
MPKLSHRRRICVSLDAEGSSSVTAVNKILTDLPAKVPNVVERAFLGEALKCYRVEAYRACIVMTWNLAYAHLLDWILKDANRLSAFNSAITKRYPKRAGLSISKYDEFLDELKEREFIEICATGGLFLLKYLQDLKGEARPPEHRGPSIHCLGGSISGRRRCD